MAAIDPAIAVAMDENRGGSPDLVLICAASPAGHQIPNAGEPGLAWGKRFEDEEQSHEIRDSKGMNPGSSQRPAGELWGCAARRRQRRHRSTMEVWTDIPPVPIPCAPTVRSPAPRR